MDFELELNNLDESYKYINLILFTIFEINFKSL